MSNAQLALQVQDTFCDCDEQLSLFMECERFFPSERSAYLTTWINDAAKYQSYLTLLHDFYTTRDYNRHTRVPEQMAHTFATCVGNESEAFRGKIRSLSPRLFGWLLAAHLLRVALYWWPHDKTQVCDEVYNQFEQVYQTWYKQVHVVLCRSHEKRIRFKMDSPQVMFLPYVDGKYVVYKHIMTLPAHHEIKEDSLHHPNSGLRLAVQEIRNA